jgi:hypothetical protein
MSKYTFVANHLVPGDELVQQVTGGGLTRAPGVTVRSVEEGDSGIDRFTIGSAASS